MIVINCLLLEGNTAINGSAIVVKNGSVAAIGSSHFEHNAAIDKSGHGGYGGAIYTLDYSGLIIWDSSFSSKSNKLNSVLILSSCFGTVLDFRVL